MIVKFHSEARTEFFVAAEYYESKVAGLGEEFIYEIEKVLIIIQQYPSIGTKITPSERRFLTNRFPYGIIYNVKDELITILAIMNLRQDPDIGKSVIRTLKLIKRLSLPTASASGGSL